MDKYNSRSIIIWIDGTYGVGKSTAANNLLKNYKPYNKDGFIVLESDFYYQNGIKSWKYIGGGAYPQNNLTFLSDFRRIIEKHASETDAVIVVVMALTMDESKNLLLGYFTEAGFQNIHIILDADPETIESRVNNSPITRNKSLAINNIQINIKYLKDNYTDAEWVDTNEKTINDVAESITNIINQHVRINRINRLS